LELVAFFFFFYFGQALARLGLEKSSSDLFMWKSILVPLAAWNFRLVFIPDALDRDMSHSVAGSFKSGTDYKLGRQVGFVLLSPLKINISTHNYFISGILWESSTFFAWRLVLAAFFNFHINPYAFT
jgi:hypothetical protein